MRKTNYSATENEFTALVSQAEIYGLPSEEISRRFSELTSRKRVYNGKRYWQGYFSHWRNRVWNEKLYVMVLGRFGAAGEIIEVNATEFEAFWLEACKTRTYKQMLDEFVLETRYYWQQSAGVNLPHKAGSRIYARYDNNNNMLPA